MEKYDITDRLRKAPLIAVRQNRDSAAKTMVSHPLIKKLSAPQAKGLAKLVVRMFNDKYQMRLSILYNIDATLLLHKGCTAKEIKSLLALPPNSTLSNTYGVNDEED